MADGCERIHLPMQKTWVWFLVWEDSTCCRATKPMCRNYWACARESGKPRSHSCWNPCILESMLCNKRSHCNEKSVHCKKSSPCSPQLEKAFMQQGRPSTAKNKYKNNVLKYLHLVYKPSLVMMDDPFYMLLTLICMWVSFLVLPVSDFSIKVKLLSESKSSLFLLHYLLLSGRVWAVFSWRRL